MFHSYVELPEGIVACSLQKLNPFDLWDKHLQRLQVYAATSLMSLNTWYEHSNTMEYINSFSIENTSICFVLEAGDDLH